MSSLIPLSTTTEDVVDPVVLEARLKSLRKEYDQTRLGIVIPNGASEAEICALRAAHSERQISLVREQIAIVAKLRGRAAGPARAGGKRAKKAPLDMSHLLSD